jgi:pimeloyl-ACP methyl ester carboxylesterase
MSNQTQFLEKYGGKIAYDDTGGTGPLIIAAPGMGDTRGVYRHLSPLLTKAGLRLVTFDIRGMGESSTGWKDYSDAAIASDYISLLVHLKSPTAILMGSSKTAASAVIAATSHPDKVSGLVLFGPFARESKTKPWEKFMFGITLGGPWGRKAWVSYYKNKLYPLIKPRDHEEYVAALSKNLAEPGRYEALKQQAKDPHQESGQRLGDVRSPSLVIMGTDDPDFPNPRLEANELAALLKGNVLFVERSGHYPQADNPEEISQSIIDFAKQQDQSALVT